MQFNLIGVEATLKCCDILRMAKTDPKEAKEATDLSHKAFVGIRQMLFHNEIVAGQKVPFKDLAVQMGMSVTPVIQALKFLEFQGLVRREPNKGYFIETLKLDELEGLYKFRRVLELTMLEDTIARLDDAGEVALQAVHQVYLETLNGNLPHQKLIADMNFHLTIARLSDQKIQFSALKNVFDILHLKYKASLGYVTREQSNQLDHGHILDAILARDLPRARDLLSSHIENSRTHAFLNLQQMIDEKSVIQF